MAETLATIGEFGLIDRIQGIVDGEGISSPGLHLGLGDDAACFSPEEGWELLVTCDSVVEGRHYLPGRISPLELGRRSMTLNISDIGAMGGLPRYALVSLGLRADTPVSEVEDLYRGFLAELNPFGASLIGGNITRAEAPFIDITLIGQVEKGQWIPRSGAKAGDAILVTGHPGQAAAGLHILSGWDGSEYGDIRDHPLVREYNTPSHRAREGRAVARSGRASAMIDTSDGFLGDLGHICAESGVGAELVRDRLPVSEALRGAAEELHKDPYELFLGESDDYELIITCAPGQVDPIRTLIGEVSGVPVADVGRILDEAQGMALLLPDGGRRPLSPSGWDHFAAKET